MKKVWLVGALPTLGALRHVPMHSCYQVWIVDDPAGATSHAGYCLLGLKR